MRFRTQLLVAFAALALLSAAPLAWTALESYQRVSIASAQQAFRQAAILLDAFVAERSHRLSLILDPFSEDARIRAAMMARADLADPRQLGTTAGERRENADAALASWVDESAAALQDFVMLVGRDGQVAYAVARRGGVPLEPAILDSQQVRFLVQAAGRSGDARMLWSGPRLRQGPPPTPELDGQVYFAGARLLRYRFTGTGRDELVGMAVVAERFDLALALAELSKAGVSLVFVDKDRPIAWHLDSAEAEAIAAEAARWVVRSERREQVQLHGKPYLAREYTSAALLTGPVRVVFLYSLEPSRTVERTFLRTILIALALTLTGAAILAALFARRVARPVGELIGGAERVARGELDTQVTVKGAAELTLLGDRFNQMVDGLRERELARDALGRYLSPQLARQVLERREELGLLGERRPLTLLFCDLAGFTGLSERVSAEELLRLLNEYLEQMVEVLTSYDAYVDKFAGDAIMAFWGAPLPSDRHAEQACRAALRMKAASNRLAARWAANGIGELRVRFGLNTGEAVVGNLGSRQKLNYTAIGDEVNLASRLEGLNKRYGTDILLGERTARAVAGSFELREIDRVRVYGRSAAVTVFELLSERGELPPDVASCRDHFQAALAKFRARDLDAARQSFREADLCRAGGDGAARVFLERIDALSREGIPADWDATFEMRDK